MTNSELINAIKTLITTQAEVKIWSKDNPLAPRVSNDYLLTDANNVELYFPHVWTHYDSEGFSARDLRNIFDQTITIISTLDVALTVEFRVIELAAGLYDTAPRFYSRQLGTIPAYDGSTASTLVLTPEVPTDTSTTVGLMEHVPELRQPFPAFAIRLTRSQAPTTGELKILEARRY